MARGLPLLLHTAALQRPLPGDGQAPSPVSMTLHFPTSPPLLWALTARFLPGIFFSQLLSWVCLRAALEVSSFCACLPGLLPAPHLRYSCSHTHGPTPPCQPRQNLPPSLPRTVSYTTGFETTASANVEPPHTWWGVPGEAAQASLEQLCERGAL